MMFEAYRYWGVEPEGWYRLNFFKWAWLLMKGRCMVRVTITR